MWLLVGLGNPGPKYENTRHNFGFLLADAFKTRPLSRDVIVLKPDTFMNLSGGPVQKALSFYKISPKNLIVAHDDIDLALGDVRIKNGGGHGGHNGLRDIIRLIGGDFIRLRLGVGRPIIKGMEADYVLSPFSKEEWPVVEKSIEIALLGIEKILEKGSV